MRNPSASPLHAFFAPSSVAIVGVSTSPGNLGAFVIGNLQAWGFPGTILPVGRAGGTVCGMPVLPSVDDLPAGVDLACVTTPAPIIPDVLKSLGQRGVRAVCIQSGGFGERDEAGRDLSKRLLEIAHSHQMRLIGPNGLGTLNPKTRLCLPFSPIRPPVHPGPVALLSQSGGVMLAYIRDLEEAGLGVGKAASLGNKLDLDEVDLIRYLADDPETRVIFMYLEDIRRGRALMEAAQSCEKPIVLYKANRSATTASVAASHTASLLADHQVVAAAARQAGMLLVDGPSAAIDAIKALLLPPLRGRRLAVVCRSGGHAVIGADACARHGFQLPPLPASVKEALSARMRSGVIRLGNPLDLGDLWDYDAYAPTIEKLAQAEAIDGIVFVLEALNPLDPGLQLRIAEQVQRICTEQGKPIAFYLMGWRDDVAKLGARLHFPMFNSVERAVGALAMQWEVVGRHRRETRSTARAPEAMASGPPRESPAKSPRRGASPRGAAELRTLPLQDCLRLLEERRLPMAVTRLAADPAEAARLAGQLGFPVALKIVSPELSHKSDAGGVVLGLADAKAVESAAEAMLSRLGRQQPQANLQGFAVQPMAPAGLELIVGFRQDPFFGPVLLVGLGGTLVEVLRDVALRTAPVSVEEAGEMLRELAGYPLLCGVRGAPAADLAALTKLIADFSELVAAASPALAEMELNPVIVYPEGQGCRIVDVRAFVHSTATAGGSRD